MIKQRSAYMTARIFNALPSFIRAPLVRRKLNFIFEELDGIKFTLANSQQDYEGAFSVLHDAYVAKGFSKKELHGLRITPYHLLASTSTIIAKKGDLVVGTMSVIQDGVFGLPSDKIFDISFLRNQGLKVAEISSLAIAPEFRKKGGTLCFAMMGYMIHYVTNDIFVDALVVSCNPEAKLLYDDLLCFEKIAMTQPKNYDFVEGAPAIGRYALVNGFIKKFTDVYAKNPKERNFRKLYTYCKEKHHWDFPPRPFYRATDSQLNQELLIELFAKRSTVFGLLSIEQKIRLMIHYAEATIASALQNQLGIKVSIAQNRKQSRFDAKLNGKLVFYQDSQVKESYQVTLDNVSEKGLRFTVPPAALQEGCNLEKINKVELFVNVGPGRSSKLNVELTNLNKRTNQFGCSIMKCDNQWADYIDFITASLQQKAA